MSRGAGSPALGAWAPARPCYPFGADEAQGSDPELAALWANPAFRAAIEAARADRSGEVTLEELEREHPLTEEEQAAADAWLDAYERQLAREAEGGNDAPTPPAANPYKLRSGRSRRRWRGCGCSGSTPA